MSSKQLRDWLDQVWIWSNTPKFAIEKIHDILGILLIKIENLEELERSRVAPVECNQ